MLASVSFWRSCRTSASSRAIFSLHRPSKPLFPSSAGFATSVPERTAKKGDAKEVREKILSKRGFIIDMDGVVYHSDKLLPGVKNFLSWLHQNNRQYLFLTNASEKPRDVIKKKIKRLSSFDIPVEKFYTSAMATAAFLHSQTPRGSAFVIGSVGLVNALHEVGFRIDDNSPDYVVIGETKEYSYHMIERAVYHLRNGARLIGTNKDVLDKVGQGLVPSTGTLVAPIEKMVQRQAYFVGKPNPLMVNQALKLLDTPKEDTVIIGDRMDTDIVAGVESGIDTLLVLSGVTNIEDLVSFGYRPKWILNGVKDLVSK